VAEIARAAACHVNDVQRIESGDQAPSIGYVIAVADRFGVTADYLLGRVEEPRPWDAIPASSLPAALLRDAILLTHPDRHPPARSAKATRVTQDLNALLDRA
jgi:transcriptional regulator with XRE-family HTH domain